VRHYAPIPADRKQVSNKIYVVLWFCNRLLFWAKKYKIPAQQQAVNRCTLSMMHLLSRYKIILCLLSLQLFACRQEREKEVEGYIVYILPNNIRFVETKKMPDENYKDNFITSNFSKAFSFKPDSILERTITEISSDTLYDENPEMKEHTRFLKEIIVFPAIVRFKETPWKDAATMRKKFKVVYKGQLVEFEYNELGGEVVQVSRLGSAS
jgi:hypothetical protein